jgi:hypothetical protein
VINAVRRKFNGQRLASSRLKQGSGDANKLARPEGLGALAGNRL